MKPEVGQTIWLVPTSYNRSQTPIKVTVKTVGKKYFTVNDIGAIGYNDRFLIEEMKHDGRGYSSMYDCYLSEQEILDKRELDAKWKTLSHFFAGFVPSHITLEQAREICKILEIKE